jgi:hypothetical protein
MTATASSTEPTRDVGNSYAGERVAAEKSIRRPRPVSGDAGLRAVRVEKLVARRRPPTTVGRFCHGVRREVTTC